MNDSGLLWTMDEQKKASLMAAKDFPRHEWWGLVFRIQNDDDDGIYVYIP
jgi:hypothetical protein